MEHRGRLSNENTQENVSVVNTSDFMLSSKGIDCSEDYVSVDKPNAH